MPEKNTSNMQFLFIGSKRFLSSKNVTDPKMLPKAEIGFL